MQFKSALQAVLQGQDQSRGPNSILASMTWKFEVGDETWNEIWNNGTA
jgi:hypothetical protein